MSGDASETRGRVRERYAGLALAGGESCCGPSGGCSGGSDVEGRISDLTGGSYSEGERGELPGAAYRASLGCGNPVMLATLSPGEVVLDLGSGGGIDVLLSAKRVSPGGKAYGLDMTDEMLALAEKNRVESGLRNVEFLKGEIESVPLPDGHVDVVISNCVVNLPTDKPRVISEAYRVLKDGGRLAVSDVVFLGRKSDLPPSVREKVELWTGCVVGALERDEYEKLLREAGFEDVSVEVTNEYDPDSIEGLVTEEEKDAFRRVPAASAFIRARKG